MSLAAERLNGVCRTRVRARRRREAGVAESAASETQTGGDQFGGLTDGWPGFAGLIAWRWVGRRPDLQRRRA